MIFVSFHPEHCFLDSVAFALDPVHQAARPDEFRGEQAQAEKDGEPAGTWRDEHNHAEEQ